MPNGYGPAIRAFTKLMKSPFSFLRSEGYLSVIYVDNCYLQGDSFTKCAENVIRTIDIPYYDREIRNNTKTKNYFFGSHN